MIFVGLMMFGSMKCFANIAKGVSGTCNWVITDEGQLIVSPVNGVEGELGTNGYSSLLDGTVLHYNGSPWDFRSEYITSVLFKGTIIAKSCAYMFNCCFNLKSIEWGNFKTDKVTDMYEMFNRCKSLESLNLSCFNTSNVIDMEGMFGECESLKSLDLSNFNTSKVENMSWMFSSCKSLAELNVTNFNTSKVKDMSFMFNNCKALKYINVMSFDMSSVRNISYMFQGCSALEVLDLTNFSISKDVNYSGVFGLYTNPTGIVSNTVVPPALPDDFFDGLRPNRVYFDVFVAKGGEDLYKSAPAWRKIFRHYITDEKAQLVNHDFTRYALDYSRKVSGKYASFCLPFSIDVKTWREEYCVTNRVFVCNDYIIDILSGIKLNLDEIEGIISAGEPFWVELMPGQTLIGFRNNLISLLNPAKSTPKRRKFYVCKGNSHVDNVTIELCGSLEEMKNLDKNHYRAFNNEAKFGPTTWIKPFRAYVYVDGLRNEAKFDNIVLEFEDGTTTSIEEVDGMEVVTDNAPVYNLNGQRVNGNAKGLLIKNGKKMFVK